MENMVLFKPEMIQTKRLITRALCQKNEGSVEFKQSPIKMGGMTLYRILSP
jgi:hypothetical protein